VHSGLRLSENAGMAGRPIHAPRAGWPVLVSVVLLSTVGCGAHYWQRQGAVVQDFQQDSQLCVSEAKAPRLNIEPEQMYRACMRARGWQRVKAGVPERDQFRGPEDVADFDNPPSPTAGQGVAHSDAATEAACRGARVSRPPGVVCRGR
jgi:hypothetical protein